MLRSALCGAGPFADAIALEYDSPGSLSHAGIAAVVAEHGHVVMRPRAPLDRPPYEEILAALGLDAIEDYGGGTVVRQRVACSFLATDQVAPELFVAPHNEMAYTPSPPDLACFVCVRPPTTGGDTTVFDGRVAQQRLPPGLRARLLQHSVVWRRTLGPVGPAPSWQAALRVSSFAECPARAQALGYRVLEVDERAQTLVIEHRGSQIRGGCLVTSIVDQHPITYATLYAGSFPTVHASIRWDDGEEVSTEDLLELARAFVAARRGFHWARPGDFVVLDNHRFAHGREPYTGEREIVVTLGATSWLRRARSER